jgi:Glycosyltransferase family 87
MTPAARAAILGLTAILIGLPIPSWAFFFMHVVPDGHTDFRANYTAGYLLRTGQPLYNYNLEMVVQNLNVSREVVAAPFIHPAYEALLYVPLAFLTYVQAYWVWFVVNVAILIWVYRLLQPELNRLRAVAPWVPAATLAAFLPIGGALVQGQDSLLVLLLCSLAFNYFRDSEHSLAAGMLLGLAVFRFQIVAPILLCFLLWRRWSVVIGSAITATCAAVLSAGVGGFWPYVRTIIGLSVRPELDYLQPTNRMPNLRGLIHSLGGGDWIVFVASLIMLGLTVFVGRRCQLQQQLCLAISVAALVSYHGFIHDLSILFIPLAYLIGKKQLPALAIVGLCFFTPHLMSFVPAYSYLGVIGLLVLFGFLSAHLRQVTLTPG